MWASINVSGHIQDGSTLKSPISIWLSLSLFACLVRSPRHFSKRSPKHSSRHSPFHLRTVTSKVPESACIDEDTDRTNRDMGRVPILYFFIFGDFKISLFRLKPPGFLNKNNDNLRVLKFQVNRSACMMKLFCKAN